MSENSNNNKTASLLDQNWLKASLIFGLGTIFGYICNDYYSKAKIKNIISKVGIQKTVSNKSIFKYPYLEYKNLNLLLFSNGKNDNQKYFEHCEHAIMNFIGSSDEKVLFIPYTSVMFLFILYFIKRFYIFIYVYIYSHSNQMLMMSLKCIKKHFGGLDMN